MIPGSEQYFCNMFLGLHIKRKRGNQHCSSFHASRPSHCPICQERATSKPTPICITAPCISTKHIKILHIPQTSTAALFLDRFKVCEVSKRQNKTSSKRLSYYMTIPPSPSLGILGVEYFANISIFSDNHSVIYFYSKILFTP